jgi:hypothetical protein
MVLLDATSPDAFTVLPSFPGTNAIMRRLYALGTSLSRLGLGHLVGIGAGAGLPAPAKDQVDAFATRPREIRTSSEELSQLRAALAQARELTDLGGKPLAVVTARQGQESGWSVAQDRLAGLSTNTVHRVVPATHQSVVVDRADSAYSAQAIADVVGSVRTRSPLPAS